MTFVKKLLSAVALQAVLLCALPMYLEATDWTKIKKNGYSFATGALLGMLFGATQSSYEKTAASSKVITHNQFYYGTSLGNILAYGGSLATTKLFIADADKQGIYNKPLLYIGTAFGTKLAHYLTNYIYNTKGIIRVSYPVKIY